MNLPFHLGGVPDGTEAVYRCEFDHESNSYIEAKNGDSACRWNSICGFIYWKPWGYDDQADDGECYEPESGLFGDY